MRTLELFAGIGGLHAACPWLDVVAAVDINRDSRIVYAMNFETPYFVRELETIPVEWLASQRAEVWWMSPPCTPFTRKGEQRDVDDVRARSLIHLIDAAACIRPKMIVLENVVGFETSRAFDKLDRAWRGAGYGLTVETLCPTRLGWPNRRPRVYVMACQGAAPALPSPTTRVVRCSDLIETDTTGPATRDLQLDPEVAATYRKALDIVDPEDPKAVAACFGASYGRAITKAGSYLRTESGLRRFSPREVANLLGFPRSFMLPMELSVRRLWHLLGNSLSLPAVQHIMQGTRP